MATLASTTKPIFTRRQLTRLIWPLIIEQGLAITVGLADSMMVASVGEAAMSGVSLVDMISLLLIQIFAALATGGAVVTSQFIGAKDMKTARRSTDQLLIVTTALSVLITVAAMLFRTPLLRLCFGKVEKDVMEHCMTYFSITALSYPFIALYNASAAIFRSLGNSKLSMKVSLLMNAINLGGNALLIYVCKMGVEGVAIPTLVSRMVAAIVMIAMLYRKDNPVRLSLPHKMRLSTGLTYRILTIGIPNAVENGMFQFGRISVAGMISGLGTAHIAANAICNNVCGVLILVGQALSLAIVTVIGQCVGAQDLRQAKRYAWQLVGLSSGMTAIISVAVFLLLPIILWLYNASAEAAGYVTTITILCCIITPLTWSLSFNLPCVLRAANDVKFTSTVAVLSMWIFRVGMSYVLAVQMNMGVVGVWISMFVDWVVRLAFYLARFLSGKWQRYATFKALS